MVIAGDSIVKQIAGGKMTADNFENHFIVRSFPGATISDVTKFVKSLARMLPDKVVLHVGTNDLVNYTTTDIAKSFHKLVETVKMVSPNTAIGVSALLVRTDNNNLADKALQVNIILKEYCLVNSIAFLDNLNINSTHLNNKGLHLNKEGASVLQQNLLEFVNNITH